MNQELIGQGGEVVGSSRYFKELNDIGMLDCIMKDKDKYNYYDSVRNIVNEINNVFYEIYDDLKDNADVMRYVDYGNRKNLIDLISNLSDVAKFGGSISVKGKDCISILQLSSSATNTKSNAGNSEIDNAISMINKGSLVFSTNDSLDLLRKATNWSVDSVIDKDPKKHALFSGISNTSKLPSRYFLNDVLTKYDFIKHSGKYKGKCGKEICSKDYLNWVVKSVFGEDLSVDTKFYDSIKKSFESVVKTINDDLKGAVVTNKYIRTFYIKSENSKMLIEAFNEIEKCGIKCSGLQSKVEKLTWTPGLLDIFTQSSSSGAVSGEQIVKVLDMYNVKSEIGKQTIFDPPASMGIKVKIVAQIEMHTSANALASLGLTDGEYSADIGYGFIGEAIVENDTLLTSIGASTGEYSTTIKPSATFTNTILEVKTTYTPKDMKAGPTVSLVATIEINHLVEVALVAGVIVIVATEGGGTIGLPAFLAGFGGTLAEAAGLIAIMLSGFATAR